MHQDLVEKKRWISAGRFLHALNYCMVLPGPEAQQLATYIGWLLHGAWGGLVAGALFVLPSLLLLMALAWVYLTFGDVPAVAGLLYGIKPAVVALVCAAAVRIGARTLQHPLLWGIAASAGAAIVIGVPFPAIIAIAGLSAWLVALRRPQIFSHARSSHGTSSGERSPTAAVIDDHTPSPTHACWSWWSTLRVVAIAVGLWLGVIGLLIVTTGWTSTLTAMGWFFTKAALLTFGGAYAVLPYVWDGAVSNYGWLSTPQMIDGLALGESTPGPLIMIVAFVGFLGGWQTQALGPEHLALGGILAAAVVTWFTFLPSFMFILAGGPMVESTRGQLGFTAPLTGISAAVVGVIASLGAFFAYHVCWPQGFAHMVDGFALVVALIAFVALWRWRCPIIPLLAACAVIGMAWRLLS